MTFPAVRAFDVWIGRDDDIQLESEDRTPMTTQPIYTDILTRLLMLLALLGLFLAGLSYAPEIAASLSQRLERAATIQVTSSR